ncbi:MAG TPA: anti-sigma factor [Chthoniobacterales bacterium]
MKCEECQDFIDAYVDNELDTAAVIPIRRHLRDCPKCRQLLEARKGLRTLLDQPQLRFDVPASLRAKVLSALPAASPDRKPWVQTRTVAPWFLVPLALAAALVLVFGLAFLRKGGVRGPSQDGTLVAQVISSHVRSLLATHLLDVPSTDQHTVKPWFAGKLEFSPPVQDFAEHGFSLIGGRLDYVDGREVAALVYRRKQHLINLFIWPSESNRATALQNFTENGYNTLHWDQRGFSFWAVSDVQTEDLRALAALEMQPL